ncbi:MAG: polysaccharide deacetylase family protein, partial [Melioribacteraceae bacterium]
VYTPQQQKDRTEKLLKTFKKYEIPVVGFVNEYKLFINDTLKEERLEVLKQWNDNNFELGNHTYSHRSLNRISVEEYEQDILKGERFTKELLAENGKQLRYFRYPFLQKGNEEIKKIAIEKFLKEQNYINAPVTVDNSEWVFARAYDVAIQENDSAKIKMLGEKYIEYMTIVFGYFEKQSEFLFQREIKQILLLHANALNTDYFDKLCEMMLNRNYKFITLEEALKDPVYEKEENYVGNWGFSWINRWALTDGKGKDFYKDEPEPDNEIFKLAGIEN